MGIGNSACLIFLGCPKNQVDSEHVLGSLTEAGYTLTTDPRSAGLIVITTCAFLQSAVRESEAAIREALKLKQRSPCNPETDMDATKARTVRQGPLRPKTRNGQGEPPINTDNRAGVSEKTICVHPCPSVVSRSGSRPSESGCPTVVVAGCLVERYGKSLKRKSPAVDLWVPLRDMPQIPRLLASSSSVRAHRSSFIAHRSVTPRVLSTPRHFAYLKIADGCDNRCSYCMIPDIRGAFHSRPLPDILAEASDLARAGVKELILVAQDTTLYGTDLRNGAQHQGTKAPRSRLAELLGELGRIDGIQWLRLMYTHPAHVTEDVIDQFACNPKLCRYIDLPIQHIADHLLEKMNRRYTRQDVELLLHDLHATPDMHIRTTIIVGLPGETRRDFDELLAFVHAARFDRLSCYAYSPEPGTKAARLPGQVSPAVKKERVRRLMLTQAAISRANLRKLVGRKLRVLVDALTADTESHHKACPERSRRDTKTPSPGSGNRHSSLVIRHSSEAISGLGRTEWDAPEIDGVVRLTGRSVRPGTFVRAVVTGSSTHDISARLL